MKASVGTAKNNTRVISKPITGNLAAVDEKYSQRILDKNNAVLEKETYFGASQSEGTFEVY